MSDINLVKTVVLSNNDRFYFSRKHNEKSIQKAVVKAEKAYAIFEGHSLLPDMIAQLEEEFQRKSIHGTAAIEGNPLTEDQVGNILKNRDRGIKNRSEQEVRNIQRAYEMLDAKTGQIHISEHDITSFHSVLMQDIDESNPGKYRHKRVTVGDTAHGGIDTPPYRYHDIKLLMKEFIEFINSPDVVRLNPIILGALAHYHLAIIHPFLDGNGRTARIIEALILSSSRMKYMPKLLSYYYHLNIDDYYWSFSRTRKEKSRDITHFLSFVCEGVIKSLQYAGDKIIGYITTVLLKEHFRSLREKRMIVQRQHELLQTLLKTSEPITFHDLLTKPPYSLLYRNVSERTVRRDIAKLIKLNLICLSEDGKYNLNRDILKI